MIKKTLILILSFFLSRFSTSTQSDYLKIHQDAFVVDGHNDAVQRIINGENLGIESAIGHIDIPRLKKGGIDATFFSVWVPPQKEKKSYFKLAKRQIEAIREFSTQNKKDVFIIKNYRDIEYIQNSGKIGILISMEGAYPLEDKLSNLDYFYKLGVRSIMPTWNNSTGWATSAEEAQKNPTKKGLNELGKKFIRRMNELGIIIDVSHASENTFWDIINYSNKPIIASHSSVWKICPHWRNLKDEQIKALARNNGLIAINFAPQFLDSSYAKKESGLRKKFKPTIDSIRNSWKGSALSRENYIGQLLKTHYAKILPDVKTVVDHIDYVVKLVGADYVALGSDYDGIGIAPIGLDDASFYPNITKELMNRGYTEVDIRKILGGNFLRILKENLK